MSGVRALQDCLANEHMLVHVFAVLGARTSATQSAALHEALSESYREHRSRRDHLQGLIHAEGGDPVAALPSYDVPEEWSRVPGITDAARDLEHASVESLAGLVARSVGPVRRWALTAMLWSAARELSFGALPQVWPGAPELPSETMP